MKIEDQVTSLEISKELKRLYTPQNSLFYHVEGYDLINGGDVEATRLFSIKYIGERKDLFRCGKCRVYSAYTVAELGEILPGIITNRVTKNMDRLIFFLKEHKGDDSKQNVRNGFTVEYWSSFSRPLVRIMSETEANARGKMLIHLIKEGIIKPELLGKGE